MNASSQKYCGIDVSKTILVCAVISDLEHHHHQFLPGQSTDLGIIGDEPVLTKTFNNSCSGAKDAETLTVAGSDTTRIRQEKEARTVGGIPSR